MASFGACMVWTTELMVVILCLVETRNNFWDASFCQTSVSDSSFDGAFFVVLGI